MITRRLLNSLLFLQKSKINSHQIINPSLLTNINAHSFSENTPVSIQNRQQLLQKVLKETNMLKPSIILAESEQLEERKKRTLSKQDKLKLGLYVPKMALNPRMGTDAQLTYRESICQDLYELQKEHLQTRVRILQRLTDSQHFTMDKYVNTAYKDIYARYLISKGLGVQWNGRFATYGMMNSQNLSPSPSQLISQFLKANIEKIQKIDSIAPYSYLTQSFVPTDLIEVENIRKIGYFWKLPLLEFGKHQEQFLKLKDRGSKVELLVFCEFLQKLINPQCLCVVPGQKMIILKRHFVEKFINPFMESKKEEGQQEQPKGLRFEYLITSLQLFNKHKQYFTNKQYERHLVFESDHMVGMKVEYNFKDCDSSGKGNAKGLGQTQNQNKQDQITKLPIMSEIQGYERNPGIYVVNGATSIPDYERVQQFLQNTSNTLKLTNVLDSFGKITLTNPIPQKQNTKSTPNSKQLSIIDLEFQDKLLEILKERLQFEQLYDVFEDQVYSNKQTSEVLRFRLFDKYQIPISSEAYDILQNHFSPENDQDIILHESKIQLPGFKKFNKPRERRQHKKHVRESLKQRTDYMKLFESIQSISNIPISSSVQGDIKLWIERDQEGNALNVYQRKDECKQQGAKLEEVPISTDLISALTYLHDTKSETELTSVIIEPQTFTEEIMPLALHLTLLKTKEEPVKRGRRTSRSQANQTKKVLESLKMVYLHPTMKPTQREIQVHSFITGSLKISNKHDYGYGFEAIRLWVCRNSTYLGDREIKERQVNGQLKSSAFIRKLYAQLIPLMPKSEFSQEVASTEFQKLNFLDRFMLQQIDAYILNMEHFYSRLMLKQAYEYTMDFFTNIVEEIFLSTVRLHIINFPNQKDNLSHAVTVKRILELLSVISPLLPFTTFHISKQQIMKWPQLINKDGFYKNLLEYNALIKIRTQLRNKLLINRFDHCEVVFPLSDQLSYTQSDLIKFFGVDKISFIEPEVEQKKFGFKVRHNETLGGKGKLQVYESKDHCIRCDPDSKQKDHLCIPCTSYMQKNVGKEIEFYDMRNNSLFIAGKSEQKTTIGKGQQGNL